MGLGTLGWSGSQRSKVWADCAGWTDEIRWLQATQNRGVRRFFNMPVSRVDVHYLKRRRRVRTDQHHEIYYEVGLRYDQWSLLRKFCTG